jgi:hypothetical protein
MIWYGFLALVLAICAYLVGYGHGWMNGREHLMKNLKDLSDSKQKED